MTWFVGAGTALGLLLIVYGVVCIRTGWTLPWASGRITRPWAHGLGAVFMGVPLLVQAFFYLGIGPAPSWEARFFGTNAFTFAGLGLLVIGQLPPGRNGARRN